MKLKICFPLLLCLFFAVYGKEINTPLTKTNQTQPPPVASGQPTAQKPAAPGLQIGDPLPDILLHHITGLKINGHTVSSVRLTNLKGKLLIIDFWATWCAPCRTMVPVMDSLQRAIGDRLVFLPVTYETEAVVAPVLAAMQKIKAFSLPEVTGDTTLNRLFPHRSLPHYVWIDPSGVVRAITEYKAVNGPNIRAMLGNPGLQLAVKKDSTQAYDPEVPLFLNGNGGDGSALSYHSVLSGYIPGLTGGYRISPFDPVKGQLFTVRNAPFVWLCKLAFNGPGRWFTPANTRLLSRDSLQMNSGLSGQAYENWMAQGHGYNYELLLPPAMARNSAAILQQDLARLFPQYQVSLERLPARCLALVRTSSLDRIASKGGITEVKITPYGALIRNGRLSQLMQRLQMQYLQNSALPLIDLSGYTGRVDLRLEGKLFDVNALNELLRPYDLALRERVATTELLVVRDH